MTSNEHSKVAGHLNGALCKNLFMKKKKKRYLIVFEHSKKIDLKSLGKAIVPLSFIHFQQFFWRKLMFFWKENMFWWGCKRLASRQRFGTSFESERGMRNSLGSDERWKQGYASIPWCLFEKCSSFESSSVCQYLHDIDHSGRPRKIHHFMRVTKRYRVDNVTLKPQLKTFVMKYL